jgi:DNA-binding NarL/FixJ family response regulator
VLPTSPFPLLALHLRDDQSPLTPIGMYSLLIDTPTGSALRLFAAQSRPAPERVIVLTANGCGAYLDDLWALDLHGLGQGLCGAQLDAFFARTTAGTRVRQVTPVTACGLTRAERELLRRVAIGRESKQIARELGLSDRTVANGLGRIFSKLQVSNRAEAALCYWGIVVQPPD